ncbi:MAG TPA: cellulose biosynthesis protein BcsS [Xanthobacteraceae bacterium]|nr:cellulose biosynthesis protein BcsS [Xanthobacteraceae bacterium]
MRGVACVRVVLVAAAMAVCGANNASAQFGQGSVEAEQFLLFAGVDLWRNGGFAHGGFLWSPGGLDKEGFTAKLMAGAGTYRYRIGTTTIEGDATIVDILPGWRFKPGNAEITIFAGLDFQHHRLSPDDPTNPARGSHLGLRVGADFWWEPTAGTMTNAGANFATIGSGYWARAAFGWRAFDSFFIGPEALALGDDSYRQWRIGAHLTALKTGPFEWSLGAGYVSDSDHHSGVYGRIGVLTRR